MTVDQFIEKGTPRVMAILRGVKPIDVLDIGHALVEAGVLLIEVPLNSPQPLESISRLRTAFGDRALIGAGTVLTCDAVQGVRDGGGQFIVTPNTDTAVIEHAVRCDLECFPGFFTATEALCAVKAGAKRLKLFPAGSSAPSHIKAVTEILPAGVEIWAVGGTSATNLGTWLERGAAGIGVGSALYRAGDSALDVSHRARSLIQAWHESHP